jgi:zinc transport system substrate-binding protein
VQGTPAKTGSLDPEGARVASGPDAYITWMTNIADNLIRCLSGRT